jgi:hypothetical protein
MVKFSTATAKTRDKSRAFIPTVDIINQDKITQVRRKVFKMHFIFCNLYKLFLAAVSQVLG